ncbi:hypothetical protein OROMI_005597 [Orobanche minor]
MLGVDGFYQVVWLQQLLSDQSRLVWNNSIPPKARIFLWRAFNNHIPTAANLRHHHIPTTSICSLCSDRWGSTEHCLFFCPKVSSIWKASRFGNMVKKANGINIIDLAAAVWKEWGAAEFELWGIMLWQVWLFVCRLLHPDERTGEIPSEASCIALWEAYQAARPTYDPVDFMGVTLGDKNWRKPKRGRLRVDVDAHFNPSAGKFGVGVVVRNEYGELVAALAKPSQPSSNAMMAEIMAVIQGIQFCADFHFGPVEIFTDSVLVAKVMADQEEVKQLLPEVLSDLVRMACETFLVGISHLYRSANEAAHCLASYAACNSNLFCWTADFPDWLEEISSRDMLE